MQKAINGFKTTLLNMQATRRCPKCKVVKTRDEFTHDRNRASGLSIYCKTCQAVKNAEYRKRPDFNPRMAGYMRNNYKRLKFKALQVVGHNDNPKCANCGCDYLPLLQINHKNGGGRKEKAQYCTNRVFYRAIIKGRRTIDDLDVLCSVCNTMHYALLKYKKQYHILYLGDPVATA